MPSKKKKFNARFPPARIKKIMQTDDDVGKVAAAVPVIISRALELFIESLIIKASETTRAKHAKTLSSSHIKQTILAEKQFDFLKDLVANIPDVAPSEEDTEAPSSSLSSRERASGATSMAPPPSGSRPRGRPRKKLAEGEEPKVPKKRGRKPKSAQVEAPPPEAADSSVSSESSDEEEEDSRGACISSDYSNICSSNSNSNFPSDPQCVTASSADPTTLTPSPTFQPHPSFNNLPPNPPLLPMTSASHLGPGPSPGFPAAAPYPMMMPCVAPPSTGALDLSKSAPEPQGTYRGMVPRPPMFAGMPTFSSPAIMPGFSQHMGLPQVLPQPTHLQVPGLPRASIRKPEDSSAPLLGFPPSGLPPPMNNNIASSSSDQDNYDT